MLAGVTLLTVPPLAVLSLGEDGGQVGAMTRLLVRLLAGNMSDQC
jgi:hypothetical protein